MADQKMSAKKLAELLNVNRVTVSGWIATNQIPAFRDPTSTLDALCQHLQCTPSDLIQYVPDSVKVKNF